MSWFDVTRNISRALKERSMSAVAQSLTLTDGRVEDVLLGGDPTGYPLVMYHGHLRIQPRSECRGGLPALGEPYEALTH
jgi:hypothetical protein